MNKSEIIATGKYRNCHEICGIRVESNVRCLGIYVGHDKSVCNAKNWNEKVDKLDRTLSQWKNRHLTFFGKVTILKTLGLSQIIFSAQNTTMPDNAIEDVTKIVYKFLWNNQERIKRKVLIRKQGQGGLNVTHVESFLSAIKIQWVKKILTSADKWSIIPKHLIDEFGADKLLLKISFHDIPYIKNMPPFYRQVFGQYIRMKSLLQERPSTLDELLVQPLWYNKFIYVTIRRKQQPIFLSNWIKHGIIYVKDLAFNRGVLDINYVYKLIKNKGNILIELSEIKEALRPFRNLLKQISETRPINDDNLQYLYWNAKQIYNPIVEIISEVPTFKMIKKMLPNSTQEDIDNTLDTKIINRIENKLAEFSFKLIHNSLICGQILSKWTNISPNCVSCQKTHDIPHMIYHCTVCKRVWDKLSAILTIQITLKHILLMYDHPNYETKIFINYCITAVAYNMYKYWMEYRDENKLPNEISLINKIKADLHLRYLIIKYTGKYVKLSENLLKIATQLSMNNVN